MKALSRIIISLAGLCLAASAFAQSPKGGWEVETGFVFYNVYDRTSRWDAAEISDRSSNSSGSSDGSTEYKSSPVILPSLQVMAGYNLPKYRLGFFLSAYFNYAYNNLEGGPSLLQEKESILHLLPEVRVYYSWEPKMRMYAALGYGVRFRHYDETFNGTTEGYNSINGTFTLVPFGISIGEKAAFSVDVGLGRTCAPLAMRFAYLF